MLFPHIINLHTGQLSVFKGFLKCESGMIRMNMYLYEFFIRHADDGITDGKKEFLNGIHLSLCQLLLQQNDELGTVSELDIRCGNIFLSAGGRINRSCLRNLLQHACPTCQTHLLTLII